MSFRACKKRGQAAMAIALVDRISHLPDNILGLILSNLPTKNAVATTILSKRWKSMWTTVHNLDLCCEFSRYEVDYMNFLQFVNRILLLHGCRLLYKFRFVWKPMFIASIDVHSWMSTTKTGRNVHEEHELLLLFNPNWRRMPQPLEMPISLFSSDSLQSLELDSSIFISPAIMVCLPRLESLKLVNVYFQSEETLEKLIKGCPILKYLQVYCGFTRDYGEDDVITYRISLPFLKHLDLCDGLSDLELTRSLELEASELEYLKLEGCISQVFVQGSLNSLVETNLDIDLKNVYDYDEDHYNLLAKGVRSFDRTKSLYVSSDVMTALSNATVSLSTKFTRLTKLEAQVVCCYCSSLMDFIQNSDSLEVLTIRKRTGDYLEDYNHDHSNWNPPVHVPKCLSNTLKEVLFERYTGCGYDDGMIGYLLNHGSALEVMQVTYDEDNLANKKNKVVKEISRLPRKSSACRIEFIE